jgi:Family of unknown function (DUF6011)
MPARAASDAQVSFARSICQEMYTHLADAEARFEEIDATGVFNDRAATSLMIDKLLREKHVAKVKAAAARAAADQPALDAGMYKLDGVIYKVQKAVHGSGNLYAKKLVEPSTFGARASFVYAPGVIRRLTVADRMSLEDAKAWGALYGTCCVCGRTLTDERSIAEGIGPVCGNRFGPDLDGDLR